MCCRLSSYEVKAVVARKKHTDYQNFTLFMNNKEYTVHVSAVGDEFGWGKKWRLGSYLLQSLLVYLLTHQWVHLDPECCITY